MVFITLTEQKIIKLKAEEKIFKVYDGGGLYLEVLPSGTKSWRLKYSFLGKQAVKSFGHWPSLSLNKARELAFNFKSGLEQGKSPFELQKERVVFIDLAKEWQNKFLSSLVPSTQRAKISMINRYVKPTIGHVPLSDLSPRLILERVLRPIEHLDHLTLVAKVKNQVSQILRYGVATGLVDRDHTQDLRGAFSQNPVVHRATIINPLKVGKLISDIKNYEGSISVRYAINILPYVFVRPSELRNATWDEIDLEKGTWRIPAERTKMKSPHIVPLSSQVREKLMELKKYTGEGIYLFPGKRIKTLPISHNSLIAALRYMCYGPEEICPHGFRSMASTLLNELGYNSDWIERQLGHRERNGVRAAYNHADYLNERRKMMQDWADHLDLLEQRSKLQSSAARL